MKEDFLLGKQDEDKAFKNRESFLFDDDNRSQISINNYSDTPIGDADVN